MEISLEKEFELEGFFNEILNDKNSCFNKKRVLTSQGLEFALVKKYRKL